ncbi:unnamed protein product [Rhizophagus irregularis]|uniref:Galactose oxidase n=1 Tax=Rhizophagus irregularis TaxID=588596 RepID=A0A2N1N2J1_9GLOM|nr:galactose oxidase [Rhizophagus irregularis]CAB4373236.1 unnamed protein product [Rhizophagus irregularis]CAB5393958.1 unnamed protein product [Rhizophagus irregularis]
MGYKILNHHLMLILLIQLFLWVTIINGQFTPGPRSGHTANFAGGKIYIIGGYNFSGISITTSDAFYLSGDPLTWTDLNSQGANIPFKFGHTANVGGPNQDLIFIIGGGPSMNSVYQFDTKTNKLSVIGNAPEPNRAFMGSVINGGKIYLFGGNDFNNINTLFNDLYIFDTTSLNWASGSLINAPPPTNKLTATLVNGIIYYIGGMQMNNLHTPMTNIYQYDTIANIWSLKIATLALGDVPGPRSGHTAVLVGAKICIFGGIYLNYQSPKEPIAMLDVITLQWSIPQFKNPKLPTLPNLVYHTATQLDSVMFVAFGNDTNVPNDGFNGLSNSIYVFEFNSLQWTKAPAAAFVQPNSGPNPSPNNPSPKTNPANPGATILPTLPLTSKSTVSPTTLPTILPEDQPSNKPVIVGLSVGIVLVGSAAIGALIFVFYRRKKRKEFDDTSTSNGQIPFNQFDQRSSLYPNQQQYAPDQFPNQYQQFTPQQRISNFNNLSQPQEYSGQDSILQIPSDGEDRFSNHTSNYYPGSETYPYTQGSEIPPPPPPKTP